MTVERKRQTLEEYLQRLGSVAVAFSGGVDSTFLLKMAQEALGEKVIAVTARSLSFPQRELDEAIAFAASQKIKHVVVDSEELDIDGFSRNPTNRCYLCKKELFTKIGAIAKEHQMEHVLEGSNADDVGDYRPGLVAVEELGVKSPLRHIGMTKKEIRELSKQMGLPTWNKQSFACLSSRFPYGDSITPEKLRMIDEAEQYLLDAGFHQVRVRCHGNLARIETDAAGFTGMMDAHCREKVHKRFQEIGFSYIALDIKGYRTGSMNETLE